MGAIALDARRSDRPPVAPLPPLAAEPTLAEDLLLLFFRPGPDGRSGGGPITGQRTLLGAVAGAVLTDLALGAHVRMLHGRRGRTRVEAIEEQPPPDDILRAAWNHLVEEPRELQTTLAAIGPALCAQLLDRLVDRGDLRRATRRSAGLARTTTGLEDAGTARRATLLGAIREALTGSSEPAPRAAALAALLSASGTLPQFHPEIPWTALATLRALELERGDWGTSADVGTVVPTVTAAVANSSPPP